MQAVQAISTGNAGDASGKSPETSGSATNRFIKDIGPLLNELDDASGEVRQAGSLVEALIALVDHAGELCGTGAAATRQMHHAGSVLRLLGRHIEGTEQRIEDVYRALGRAPEVARG